MSTLVQVVSDCGYNGANNQGSLLASFQALSRLITLNIAYRPHLLVTNPAWHSAAQGDQH